MGPDPSRLSSIWQGLSISPLPSSQIDLAKPFASDSMWGMIFEAGLEPEADVPSYRPSLGRVPNFSKLIDLNGPLFAAKINRALGHTFGPSIGRNFAFIHPDEYAANALASCVWNLAELGSISVRSRLIELAEHEKELSTLVNRAKHESESLGDYADAMIQRWKSITRNASEGSFTPFRVVLLSEYRASGKRLRGLRNIAKMLGWEVLGSISLADMYPIRKPFDPFSHSFYQFGYMQPEEATTTQ